MGKWLLYTTEYIFNMKTSFQEAAVGAAFIYSTNSTNNTLNNVNIYKHTLIPRLVPLTTKRRSPPHTRYNYDRSLTLNTIMPYAYTYNFDPVLQALYYQNTMKTVIPKEWYHRYHRLIYHTQTSNNADHAQLNTYTFVF